jgi:hypothetical protein
MQINKISFDSFIYQQLANLTIVGCPTKNRIL